MADTRPQAVDTIVILADYGHCEGGAAKIAIQSAIGLAEQGKRVLFIAGADPIDPDLASSSVEIHSLGQPSISAAQQRGKSFLTALWNRDAARQVAQIIAPLDPQRTVVHIHAWTKVLSSSVLPEVKKRGFKTILTLHDYFTVCPNGGFFDYPAEQICTRTPMGIACVTRNCDSRRAVHKVWRLARQVLQQGFGGLPKQIDAFITISDLSERVLAPHLPKGAPLWRVENPIECSKKPPATPEEGKGVLYVGRLAAEKGPHLLAQAAQEAGVTVTFAGDGPLKAALEQRYPEHRFLGWVDFATISQELLATRALVFPSLWYETLGLSVQEAMAQGIPALVSSGCAAAGCIRHGETGMLFDHGNKDALVQGLKSLDVRDTVKTLGRAAYQQFWADPPTRERHIAALLEVYGRLLA